MHASRSSPSNGPHFQARIERLNDHYHDPSSLEQEALMRSSKRLLERASSLGKSMPSEVMVIANNLEDPGRLADLTSSNLELDGRRGAGDPRDARPDGATEARARFPQA